MKNKIGWILAIVLGLVILIGLPLLLTSGWVGGAPYHRGMMDRYGMMGRGFGVLNPLEWLGIALMWLIPIGVLVVLVLGSIALIRVVTAPRIPAPPAAPVAASHPCPNCGKPTQPDWNTCPYCGNSLAE
jgi:hypothetical protein